MGQLLTNRLFATMSINNRLIALRREQNLTQQEMADRVGLHVNQIRRYEAGTAQPSLEALKKIALAISVTIDSLVFENSERGPNDEFKLQFEAVCQFPMMTNELSRHCAGRHADQAPDQTNGQWPELLIFYHGLDAGTSWPELPKQ